MVYVTSIFVVLHKPGRLELGKMVSTAKCRGVTRSIDIKTLKVSKYRLPTGGGLFLTLFLDVGVNSTVSFSIRRLQLFCSEYTQ